MGSSWADLTGNIAYSTKTACEDFIKDWKTRLIPGDDVQCRALPVDPQ